MWIYSLNYSRTVIITWLVGRLMWTESHIPVLVLLSGTPGLGSLARAPLLQLAIQKPWLYSDVKFWLWNPQWKAADTEILLQKAALWNFYPCSGQPRTGVEGLQPLTSQRCWIWRLPFPARLEKSHFTLEQTRKRNREIMVFECFWNHSLR